MEVRFTDVATGTLDTFACDGGTVEIDGIILNTVGIFDVDFPGGSSANCDSTTVVNFTLSASIPSILDTMICRGNSFTKGLDTYDVNMTSGTSLLENADRNGCDSLIEVTVDFFPQLAGILDTMICAGDDFNKGNDTYDANNLTGNSTLSGAAEGGCDSLLAVTVSLIDQINLDIRMDICEGETIVINGTTYGQGLFSGMEILPAIGNGCDTLATITITEIIPEMQQVTDVICPDGELIINGTTYNAANLNGQESNQSAQGCDSLLIDVALSVSSTSAVIENELLCANSTIGSFDLTSITGLTLPLDVYVAGTLVETVTTLPITIAAAAGMNMITLDDGNCTYETSVTVDQQIGTGNTQILVTDLGMNNYSLTYSSDIIPDQIGWNPAGILDCDDCEVVMATVTEETEVSLLLLSPQGCEIVATALLPFVQIIPDSTTLIYITDIFQPLDSQNGTFYVQSNFETMIDRLAIYDRWGNLVFLNENFLSNDIAQGWTGFTNDVPAEQGVYVYHIEYKNQENGFESVTNNLTLIR